MQLVKQVGWLVLVVVLAHVVAGPQQAVGQTPAPNRAGYPRRAPEVTVVNSAEDPVPVSGSVRISSSARAPLFVQAVDLSEPYLLEAAQTPPADQDVATLAFDIPAGKRLVVETVTVRADVPPGQAVRTFLRAAGTYHALTIESQGVINGFDRRHGTHPIRLRVDGRGSQPEMLLDVERPTGSGGTWFVGGSIAGYLVPLPS
jgi:hypothetical protein